jgi:hypothetical protein
MRRRGWCVPALFEEPLPISLPNAGGTCRNAGEDRPGWKRAAP